MYLLPDERATVDATALALEREPSARVFATEDLSQMLLWRHPEIARGRVGFDIRYEALEQSTFRRIASALGRGAEQPRLLRRFDLVVVGQGSLLQKTLARAEGWKVDAPGVHGYVRYRRVGR